jgi:predicted acylesterase/phospholipase RssA
LSTSEYVPDWVAGISIGAIIAAIIAGNAPEVRLERLRAFWERITAPSLWPVLSGAVGGHHRRTSSLNSLIFGQPGFFAPRPALHYLLSVQPTSFYDTSELKSTLEQLVDFDRINTGELHFSIGAVKVRSGDFINFDNAKMTIRPEHVMASAALPPGFPAVEIDGEHYWDGGLVSNTARRAAPFRRPAPSTMSAVSSGPTPIPPRRRAHAVVDLDRAALAVPTNGNVGDGPLILARDRADHYNMCWNTFHAAAG